jgi:hypothetical protein
MLQIIHDNQTQQGSLTIWNIVRNPEVKQLFTFNQIYSMILSHKIIGVFMSNHNKWNRGEWVEREREEQQINGVSDGALDRNGNGMGRKWTLGKRDTWVFLVKTNQKNKKAANHVGWISNSSVSLVPQHLFSWWHVSPQIYVLKVHKNANNTTATNWRKNRHIFGIIEKLEIFWGLLGNI